MPSDLGKLLNNPNFDNVTVDQTLFDLYADELNAFDAVAGNTVTVVVPEPSTSIIASIAFVAMLGVLRVRRRRF